MGQAHWRELKEPDFEKAAVMLNKKIKSVDGPPRNILLMGLTGAGKSSFINTVASIIEGRIANVAHTKGVNLDELGTRKFKDFNLTAGFKLYDIPGYGEKLQAGADMDYLKAVVSGHVRLGAKLDAEHLQEPSTEHQPLCVVFVMSAPAANSERNLKKMAEFHTLLPEEIARILVITMIDQVCSSTNEDITYIYKSETVHQLVKKASTVIGIEENAIFPVVNFTREAFVYAKKSVPHLYAISQAIDFASDRRMHWN